MLISLCTLIIKVLLVPSVKAIMAISILTLQFITHLIFMATLLVFKTIYLESHTNPADPILHREPGPAGKQIFPSFKLPDELSACFVHA